jgi:hypothetical protein
LRLVAVVLAAVPALPGTAQAQNRQPISTSLVECAAIFANFALSMADKGKPAAEVASTQKAADAFVAEAVAQATREGVADPRGHIVALGAEMAASWENRLADLAKFTENMDWIDYCAALGESRNILPIKN